MLHMSHPLVLSDAFSGLLFVNKVLLPCEADKWHSVCEKMYATLLKMFQTSLIFIFLCFIL